MRLLHTRELKVKEFTGKKIPEYVILSHTWEEEEVTLKDINARKATNSPGYEKVKNASRVALERGYEYIWIDTCCINKKSSTELQEAINSMYQWYEEAEECFAYLADVPPGTIAHEFEKSKWFTRGWTLQELIAPSTVIFFNKGWQVIGSKENLQELISDITSIPRNFLLGDDLRYASIAQRMSWASKRKTTRIEDTAYCLMGIFGIHMTMLYGEKKHAFIRLQTEIMRVSNDHSIFAWRSIESSGGLLATSPSAFANSANIIQINSLDSASRPFEFSSERIRLSVPVIDIGYNSRLAILRCTELDQQLKQYQVVSMIGNENRVVVAIKKHTLNLQKERHISGVMEISYSVKKSVGIKTRDEHGMTLLIWAAKNGYHSIVQLLIKNGVNVEVQDDYGKTSLIWAIKNGHESIVQLLVRNGVNIKGRDGHRMTLLMWTAKNGYANAVQLLVEKGVDVEAHDDHGMTSLMWATKSGHENIVKLLLVKNALVEAKDDNGWTPLMWAVKTGYERIAKLLLKQNANVNTKDNDGWTPLMWAVDNGNEDVVKLVLKNGAHIEVSGDSGRTLLLWGITDGHRGILKLLLENGAHVKTDDYDGWTMLLKAAAEADDDTIELLLSWAAVDRREDIMKLLLKRGGYVETENEPSWTSLLCAASNGHETIVQLLLEIGAELEFIDMYGQTPLMHAAKNGHKRVAVLLLMAGARLESRDKLGRTSLSWAAQNEHEDMVGLFLAADGINPDSKDNDGWTPLSWAARNGHESVYEQDAMNQLLAKEVLLDCLDEKINGEKMSPPGAIEDKWDVVLSRCQE
ncbi:hypothetical protein B7463_g11331, partial [Scytalidium lignicola]